MTQEGQTITRRAQPAPIVLGAVAFGKPKPTTRDHPLSSDESCDNLLKLFYERGGRELDTARVYQNGNCEGCLLYTSPSPRDRTRSRMPSSA